MDRYTDTLTDANQFYNLSHAICYSYGTDNNTNSNTNAQAKLLNGSFIHPTYHIVGHFRGDTFQAVDCIDTEKQKQETHDTQKKNKHKN